jgi:hypothetical protein
MLRFIQIRWRSICLDHVLIAGCTTALVRVRFTMSFEWQNGLAP